MHQNDRYIATFSEIGILIVIKKISPSLESMLPSVTSTLN